jgi:hypothetical protein
MLRKDKNGFIDIIRSKELELTLFKANDDIKDEFPAFVVELKSTPLVFWTRNNSDSHFSYDCNFTTFSPTFQIYGYIPHGDWYSNIQQVYDLFATWITNHVKPYLEEQTAEDLWDVLLNGEQSFELGNVIEEDIDYFSENERKFLTSKIMELRTKIIEQYSPDQYQLMGIDKKLNYLTDAVNRLNKFDWKSLLLTTLLGITTTLSLDKTTGETLFVFAKHLFSEGLMLLK